LGRRGRRNKNREPIEVTITHLEPKGAAGVDGEGKSWRVRGAPLGSVVAARPGRKQTARLLEVVQPAEEQATPVCSVYGMCGGCQLQDTPIEAQRQAKQAMVERLVGHESHAIRGADAAYGYRNKLELSFGVRRYLPEADKDADSHGDWVGFHPPGWFSKIVPIDECPLATDGINRVVGAISAAVPGPAWDNQSHTGHWRHVVIRQGNGLVVNLVTHPDVDPQAVASVGDRLAAVDGVEGVIWTVTDRVSDVAQGETRAILHGASTVNIDMVDVKMTLPHDAFFQVNTPGAAILFETISEALGVSEGATLLDLYCGVGAIGLVLGRQFDRVIGIELLESAIDVARSNAVSNGVEGEWYAGPVEAVLPTLDIEGPRHIIVDPPRAGLHPKAAKFLANMSGEVLVYVACSPSSLSRDREILESGGWRLEKLWTVDLFPQTPHVEAVARFIR